MVFQRWCDHCQKRTVHEESPHPGVIWLHGVRHEIPWNYVVVSCTRCKASTMDYLGDDEDDPGVGGTSPGTNPATDILRQRRR